MLPPAIHQPILHHVSMDTSCSKDNASKHAHPAITSMWLPINVLIVILSVPLVQMVPQIHVLHAQPLPYKYPIIHAHQLVMMVTISPLIRVLVHHANLNVTDVMMVNLVHNVRILITFKVLNARPNAIQVTTLLIHCNTKLLISVLHLKCLLCTSHTANNVILLAKLVQVPVINNV